MKLVRALMLTAGLLSLAACVNTDYVGESYSPTTQVDVFYSMDDVDRPHTVMGEITANAMDGWDSDAMITELKTQAMAKGADAIVIKGVHTDTVGSYTSNYAGSSDPKWVVTKDGKLKEKHSGSSTSITTDTKEKVIDAELLKYQ